MEFPNKNVAGLMGLDLNTLADELAESARMLQAANVAFTLEL